MSIEHMTTEERVRLASTASAQAEFPELRIVRRKELLFHEETDAGRQVRLVDRISKDGVLRNPPIVARLTGSDRYLLLDGANRVAALDCLGISHVLVQVEQYEDPGLVLSHWNHVIRGEEARTILDMVRSVPGIFAAEASSLEKDAENDSHPLCTIAFDDQSVYQLLGGHNARERVRYLCRICNLYYHGAARIDRVSHTDLATLRKHHVSFGALVVYRDFSKEEIRNLAESGYRLPSGLTRFLMPRRVLGLNMSLSLLESEIPLTKKQHLLEEMIREKVRDGKVRYYEEPAFVFDD